jgi:hypothetical protein
MVWWFDSAIVASRRQGYVGETRHIFRLLLKVINEYGLSVPVDETYFSVTKLSYVIHARHAQWVFYETV